MNPNVLHEILNTLQRLETRLDGQDNRIGAIEFSVHSETTSPTTSRNHSVRSGGFHGRQGRCHDEDELQSPLTSACSSQHTTPASLYKAPVEELRKRFEFVDSKSHLNLNVDAPSVVELETSKIAASPQRNYRALASLGTNLYDEGVPKNKFEGTYSESAYSRPLSRLEVSSLSEMPSIPQNYARTQEVQLVEKADFLDLDGKADSIAADPQTTDNSLENCPVHPACRCSQDEGSHIPTSSSGHLHRANEPVVLMLLPCDHFKESLRYSRSLRFRNARKEQKLLAELSKSAEVPAITSSSRVSTFGKGYLRSLRNACTRVFKRRIYILQ